MSAVLAALFGVVAIAQTDSWWVAGAAVGALILLVLAIVLDVTGSTHSDAFERVLVVTSEPLPAKQVLDAVAQQTGSTPSAAELGVMVVSPEGFGRPEITNDEDYYEAARRAEEEAKAADMPDVVDIEDLNAPKALVEKLGADRVKQLVDLLD